MKDEIPIRVIECRRQLGIGQTLMSALLRGMGMPLQTRRVMKSRVVKFMADNPGFRQTDFYPKKTQASAS